MADDLVWYGDERMRELRPIISRKLLRAAYRIENYAKRLVSVQGTGIRAKTGLVVPSGRGAPKGRRVYGAYPSAPGEPPHKQTGRLRASITHELVNAMLARVGTNVEYGKYLEFGTRRMKPRPWLRRAAIEAQPEARLELEG